MPQLHENLPFSILSQFNRYVSVKALVCAFNKEKAIVETFSWQSVKLRERSLSALFPIYMDINTAALSPGVMNKLYEIEGLHLAAACHVQTHESEIEAQKLF